MIYIQVQERVLARCNKQPIFKQIKVKCFAGMNNKRL